MMMQLEQSRDGRWSVQLGFCEVYFGRKNDAETYMNKLRERVEAPHALPAFVTLLPKR
ncbi:hypothetical protein [Pseudomonas sp.]|uniref:hypothetical protein n=1 Tax=Pseudomonas sp. TaxID=306 RepID=UPI0031D24871